VYFFFNMRVPFLIAKNPPVYESRVLCQNRPRAQGGDQPLSPHTQTDSEISV